MNSTKRADIIIFGIFNIIIGFLIALFLYKVSGLPWTGILLGIALLIFNIFLIRKRLKDFPIEIESLSQASQDEIPKE